MISYKKSTSGNNGDFVRREYLNFMKLKCKNATHAVTLTFKPDFLRYQGEAQFYEAEKTIRHFLNVLNNKCYGHGYKRKKMTVGAITVIERGTRLGRLHGHLAITASKGIDFESFSNHILDSQMRCRNLGRTIHIQRYRDSGWAEYISKEGPESFSTSCSVDPNPL
jgi:hypothetical protein